jgi:hypothetical protein
VIDPQLITALTALVVALTTLLTTAVTLAKVFQHDVILKQTQKAVNGQANQLDVVASRNEIAVDKLDAQVTRMQESRRVT